MAVAEPFLSLMGPITLWLGQERRRLPFGGNTRRLFVLLAGNANNALRRDVVLDTIWPTGIPERANSALNTAVWRIKSMLTGHPGFGIEVIDETLLMAVRTPARLDAHELEAAVRSSWTEHRGAGLTEPARKRLQMAVENCRGEFLDGCSEHWVLPLRERYAALHIQAMSLLLRDAASVGDYETALLYGRRILGLDPFREGTQREVMWLYALNGQRVQAIRQYRELQEMLDRELSIAPMPETQALHRRILEASQLFSPDLSQIHGPVWPADVAPAGVPGGG